MIGDNIKKLRNKSGMTQKSLAEQLFVTAQAVSRWENNEVEPSLSTIAEMARIFNVRTDEILGVESKIEEEIKTKDQVKDNEYKPVLTLCHMCNNQIYEISNIHREGEKIYCTECVKKRKRLTSSYSITSPVSGSISTSSTLVVFLEALGFFISPTIS